MELEERSEVRMGMRGCSFWPDLRGAQRELWNQRWEAPSHGHRAWDTERVQRDSCRAGGAALRGHLQIIDTSGHLCRNSSLIESREMPWAPSLAWS